MHQLEVVRYWDVDVGFSSSHFSVLSYGITPGSMAGPVGRWTECCSLLAGHREITAEARRLLKEAEAEALSFELLNRNVDQPFKYVATWLIDEWSKIGDQGP